MLPSRLIPRRGRDQTFGDRATHLLAADGGEANEPDPSYWLKSLSQRESPVNGFVQ